jgi:hypothetical protein
MSITQDPTAADHEFFGYLLTANVQELDTLLTDDFVLIAVTQGDEIPKSALLALLGSRQLVFHSIKPAEVRVRQYGATGIVTGSTVMQGSFAGTASVVLSRYVHVYVLQAGRWRLASAQGTLIPGS